MKKFWYKNSWFFFVVGIPFFSIFIFSFFAFIAFKYQDCLVSDKWYKEGVEINNIIDQDIYAKKNNIYCILNYIEADSKIRVYLKNKDEVINIYMEHFVDKKFDINLVSDSKNNDFYDFFVPYKLNCKYNIIIYPNDKKWRLVSKINFLNNNKIKIGYG